MKIFKRILLSFLISVFLFQLLPGNVFSLQLIAQAAADTQPPTAPTNLASSSVTCTSCTLSWTGSTDNVSVTRYYVYDGTTLEGSTNGDLTYTITGLAANTTYHFTVKAKDAAGNISAASNALSVKTTADTQGPTTPTDLASSTITSAWLTLSWTASTDNVGVTGYDIYEGTTLKGSTKGEPSYAITGLTANTTYSFTVKAKDASGNVSAASTALSVKTAVADRQAPSAPAALTPSAITTTGLTLSWTASTDNVGVTWYEIYRGAEKVGSTKTTKYTDSGLAGNTEYLYTIKAKDVAGNVSNASEALSITTAADTMPPTTPSGIACYSKTAESVVLTWMTSTDNSSVAGYDIYRGASKVGSTETTTYTDSGLTANTTYSYTIKARDAAGNMSNASIAFSVSLPLAATITIPVTNGNIYFDTATGCIISADKTITSVVIPTEVNGVMVVGIGNNAFDSCKKLNQITFPVTLTSIGNGAFNNCPALSSYLGASVQYLSNPVTSITDIPAKVTLVGKPSSYYAELYASWDNVTWFLKGSTSITIADAALNASADITCCIALTGDLYTKVVVYSSKGGTKLGEFVKIGTDLVTEGKITKYDWYAFSVTDAYGVEIDIYMSAIGADLYESTDPVYAFKKRSDEDIWYEFTLKNGVWVETGVTYDCDPILNS